MTSTRTIFIDAIASPHFVPLGQRITTNYPLIFHSHGLWSLGQNDELYGQFMVIICEKEKISVLKVHKCGGEICCLNCEKSCQNIWLFQKLSVPLYP